MPSVSKVLIPATMSQSSGGAVWSNPNNAKVEDGATASCFGGPGGGGGIPNQLLATNFAFNLPTAAVIDGIRLEIKTNSGSGCTDDGYIFLSYSGGTTLSANTPNGGQNWFSSTGLAWHSYGTDTSLWGRAWTAADINNTAFGASIAARINTGIDTIYVDAIKITVFYHLGGATAPSDVPIREIYKVYNAKGQYLGNLPLPTDALKLGQDINSLGSQITLNIPVTGDISDSITEAYTTEDGTANYTTEDGAQNYTTEAGAIPMMSAAFQGIDTLIKNGNIVQAWVSNYWYPNGKCMYIGKIRRWEADFGGPGGDTAALILYSTGYDLDNYITRGAPFNYTADNVQTNYNNIATITTYGDKGGGWNVYGQSFKVGAGVTNIGAISAAFYGIATVTINVYDAPGGNLLGSSTQNLNFGVPTGVQFGFPNLIPVTPGATYFFDVRPAPGQSIGLCYNNANPYADGTAFTSSYSGGSGGGAWVAVPAQDLWFLTLSGTPNTAATFSSKDPSTGMLAPIISDYNLRGGSQQWTLASIDPTGLILTYRFNVQTIYDAMQAILSLSPNGFYYYVDLGQQIIYFKNASTTADFLLQKGVHINALKLITTTENSKNLILFTGGEVTPGVNLFKQYASNQSINAFGPLLDRKTDSRVTLAPTADAIGTSEIAELAGEQQQTTVTIVHTKKLDISLLVPGKIVGFRGYGTFVDNILVQIVHRDWTAEAVTLTLGILPTRLSLAVENTTRQLIAAQTQDNPSAPS